MKKCFLTIVAVFVLTVPVYGMDRAFDVLDKDRDEKISQQEYLEAAAKTFNRLDKDGNGFLDTEELKTLPDADLKHWLAEMDINRDGKIDRNEFQTEALERFSTADADENRCLDSREWSQPQSKKRLTPLIQFSF